MRIFIIGATGNTGRELIDLGLQRGHTITAFVRSPGKVRQRDARLAIVRGDPCNSDELAKALAGHDVVFSALGVRPPKAFRPHTLVQQGAASTVAAMTRANVQRLVFVSVAILFPLEGLRFAFFRWLLKHIARDHAAAEEIVRATALAWTIARPPRLVRAADVAYRASRDALPDGAAAMSFRALASFMLDSAERSTHVREIVGLAR